MKALIGGAVLLLGAAGCATDVESQEPLSARDTFVDESQALEVSFEPAESISGAVIRLRYTSGESEVELVVRPEEVLQGQDSADLDADGLAAKEFFAGLDPKFVEGVRSTAVFRAQSEGAEEEQAALHTALVSLLALTTSPDAEGLATPYACDAYGYVAYAIDFYACWYGGGYAAACGGSARANWC